MFLFLKKRKEENLKPLSEREIQTRLYGHLRPSSTTGRATEEIADSPKNGSDIGELFTPPAETETARQAVLQKEVPSNGKKHLAERAKTVVRPAPRKIELPKIKFNFKFSLPPFPKITLPAMPRLKKPRWFEKIERIPLSVIAVSFFAVILALVTLRGLTLWLSGKPQQPDKRLIAVSRPPNAQPADGAPVKKRKESKAKEQRSRETAPADNAGSEAQTVAPAQPKATLPPPIIQKKFYTVQVAVYEAPDQAQKIVAALKAKNLDAFLKPTKTSRGKDLYQVFLGHFKSYEEAQTELSKYRKLNVLSDFPDSFVRPQME